MTWEPSVEHLENLVHTHLKYRAHVISQGHIKPGEGLPTTAPPPKEKKEAEKPTHEGWCFTCGKKVKAETKGERHNKNDAMSVYGPCENCGQIIHQFTGRAKVKASASSTSAKK